MIYFHINKSKLLPDGLNIRLNLNKISSISCFYKIHGSFSP